MRHPVLLCRSAGAMNDLEVGYGLVEVRQGGSRFRFHYGLLRFRSGEPAHCLHRLPQREHDEFDRTVNGVLEQVRSRCPSIAPSAGKTFLVT